MPSPAEAREAVLRVDSGRAPQAVVDDLRACVRVLARELELWNGEPNPAALVTAETTCEGIRRLLGALRIAIADHSRRNAA